MKYILSMAMIAITMATVGMSSVLLSGSQAFALSGSNDKCVTGWNKDESSVAVGTGCSPDTDAINDAKKDCRESGQTKCSSSQTGQGAFSNNPNRPDNGGGITEKFFH